MARRGTRWRSWLKHCATRRKVAGPIWIVHWYHPSGRNMALWSTQLLKEMSTRYNSWCYGRLVRRADNLKPPCADCHAVWDPQPSGTLRASPILYKDCCTSTLLVAGDIISFFQHSVNYHMQLRNILPHAKTKLCSFITKCFKSVFHLFVGINIQYCPKQR